MRTITFPAIVWFTGQPGAGKTTLAKALVENLKARGLATVHLDGDEMRTITENQDYSEKGRLHNIATVQRLAALLQAQGLSVVVSVVAPYRQQRESFKASHPVCEVYVRTREKRGREAYGVAGYEPPESDFIDIDTTNVSVDDSMATLLNGLDLPSRRYIHRGDPDGEYAMFIGRFQPWHPGHRWLIDQALNDGQKVLIAIRDVPVSDKNPCNAQEIGAHLQRELAPLIASGQVKVTTIPDISSINFGRKVGYSIIEHFPPQAVKAISATAIREQRRQTSLGQKVNEKGGAVSGLSLAEEVGIEAPAVKEA